MLRREISNISDISLWFPEDEARMRNIMRYSFRFVKDEVWAQKGFEIASNQLCIKRNRNDNKNDF